MSAESQIRELVEEVFESGNSPEEVCASCPDLLPDVLKLLYRLKRVDRELDRLFPTADPTQFKPVLDYSQRLPQIEGYEMRSILGRGGMGIVFEALHVATNRIVAIKMLRFGDCLGSVELERFTREYKLLAQLNHPRIVQVYDVGTIAGQPYFTMELAKGKTLETIIERGPQNSTDSARIVEKLTQAVIVAHGQGIIHRDLKPSNVLLTEDLEPKVSDFGLARFADDHAGLTMSGFGIGTPGYMAPEQAAGRSDIGPAVDIYALGAILYQLITGRAPFCGESPAQTIQQVLTLEPIPPTRLNSQVHPDLETICLKCLEKDPSRRYANAQMLCDRLRMYLDGRPIPDRPIGNLEKGWRWCRRNPTLASTVAFSAFLAVALVIVATIFGVTQGQISAELRQTLRESRRKEVFSLWDYGRQLCESGEIGHGLLLFAKALHSASDDEKEIRDALGIELSSWYSQCHTLQKVFAHSSAVLAMAVSPDGKRCVTGCADGVIRDCILDSGESHEFARLDSAVRAIAISPDGKTLIAGAGNSQVIMWDIATGHPIGQLVGHSGDICAIGISPDGDFAITGCTDNQARLWELSTGTTCAILPHDAPVLTVAFSPDGTTIFTGGGKEKLGEFRLYDTQSLAQPKLKIEMRKPVRSGNFSPDAKTLVVGDENWDTSFWDLESNTKFAITDTGRGTVSSVAFLSSSKLATEDDIVLIGTHESSLGMFWNATKLRSHWQRQAKERGSVILPEHGYPAPHSPSVPHPRPLTSVVFVPPEGDRFLTASIDGYLRLWKKAPGQQVKYLKHDKLNSVVLRTASVSPSGELALTGGDDGNVAIWNMSTGQQLGSSLDCAAPVKAATFTTDGKQIVTGSADGWLRKWDVGTGKEVSDPAFVASGISGFSPSRSGEDILVGGGGRAQLWKTRSLQKVGIQLEHSISNPDLSVATAIAPNNDRYLTVGQDGHAKLWNQKFQQIALLSHQNEIRNCAFSRRGDWLVTVSDDYTAKIWNATDGSHIATLTHRSEVYGVAIASESSFITTSRDGAQLWNTKLFRRVGPACRTGYDVMTVACSSDGKTAALGDWRGNVAIWSTPHSLPPVSENIEKWMPSQVGMQLDIDNGRLLMSGETWLGYRDAQ